MIHFKDNKNKTALSTRWAQMSKQEQIIEKKKMEIQAKLEAQKQAAALAAQAKLSSQVEKDEKSTGNIFSNDGSFMNQYKALLEKQKLEQREKEKQEIEKEKNAKQQIEENKKGKDEVPQRDDSCNEQYNNYQDKRGSGERGSRDKQRGWNSRRHNPPHSPSTPLLEDRKNVVDNANSGSIPSLMQIPVKPPNDNNSDSESNHWEPAHNKSDEDSDTNDGQRNVNLSPLMSGSMPPPLMGPTKMGLSTNVGPGPIASESNMSSGPNRGSNQSIGPCTSMSPGPNMGPRSNMSSGSMGLGTNMCPRSLGPGPVGPGPMGPGPMCFGPMGPGPMGPRHMRLGPNNMGAGSNSGPGSNQGPGSIGPGPNSSPSSGLCTGPNMGPGPNIGPRPNMGPGPNFGSRSNMGPRINVGPRPNMGPGPHMGPRSNMGRGPNMGPGPMMGPGGPNMPPMPPGGPMPPFMGGPPNFPMPPNFMGPNGPGGPCGPGPMPPNMCPPNMTGPRPNGPMPPFFSGPPFPMMGPNGPPMPPPNGNMPFMPPFGPNGPQNFDNGNGPPLPFMPPNVPIPTNAVESGINSPGGESKKNNPPPLPPSVNISNKDTSGNMQKSSDTSQVFSPDMFPPSVHRAASEVASNGDHWENVLKAIHSQDKTLWFLQNVNSKEYKAFRELVNTLRRDVGDRKQEVKPEDKYEPEFSLEDEDSNDGKINVKEESQDSSRSSNYNKYYNDNRDSVKREQTSSQSDEEPDSKRDRKRKKKSRWSDDPPPADIKPPGVMAPLPTGIMPGPKLAKIDEEGLKLTNVNRNNQALMQYAMTNFGTTALSPEDWKKCEDNFKLNLLYQDMLKKRQEVERLAAAGKHKYEYDSDEDTNEGTWEHKLRAKEMFATEKWADELTKQAAGKHHIGDFLPPEELKKFMEKYSALKNGKEPDLSDYKEFKLKEDNVGFKMLQKLGWTEGQGLGAEGSGIVEPINKANQPVANLGLGASTSDVVSPEDDEFDAYRKRMMLAYRFRPNPLNNPRRPYY